MRTSTNSAVTAGAGIFAGALFIILMIAIIILGPFLIIWSLNTLFGFTIAYTLKTWFATLVLAGLLGRGGTTVRSS